MNQSVGGEGAPTLSVEGTETGPQGRLGRELAEIAATTFQLADELRPMLDNDTAAALDRVVNDGKSDPAQHWSSS